MPAAAFNAQRRAIARCFSANGSGETEDSEFAGMTPVALPNAFCVLRTPAKAGIAGGLRHLSVIVPEARIVVLSADVTSGAAEGVMLYTNVAELRGRVGTVFTWAEAAATVSGGRSMALLGAGAGRVLSTETGAALAYGN